MALICPICNSSDRQCSAGHTSATPAVLDLPAGPGGRSQPPSVQARAVVHGVSTIFLTTPERADAEGWEIIDAPAHKARPPVSAGNAKRPAPTPGLEALTVRELRELAKAAGLPTSGTKPELIARL